MIIRRLSRGLLERKPEETWNAFVNLLATESYSDMDDAQRIAQLGFRYDSEVQNGGHLQYFENAGGELLQETLSALSSLGAECQRGVLQGAMALYFGKARDEVRTVAEYVSTALGNEFASYDSRYYNCRPRIQELLAKYLEHHQGHFVEIVDP